MSAFRVREKEPIVEKELEIPIATKSMFSSLRPVQNVIVRELTPEEMRAPIEELPHLYWSICVHLVLEMVKDFRDWDEINNNAERQGYDYEGEDTIPHDVFVKANQVLPFIRDVYLRAKIWKGEKSELVGKEPSVHYHLYFDMARDFIRECALNNYYATYG